MAKLGEGDPRWIVEERPDATNVNNWHWVEKNATVWSKDKLKSLLEGFCIDDENISCKITELSKLQGEAMANNRKGKLIFFYEWHIEAQWEGALKTADDVVKGTIDIPNLSEEHDAEDVDVIVSTTSSSDEAYIVKEFLRVSGMSPIRNQLATYIRSLKEEYGQGAILPTKTTSNQTQIQDSSDRATSSKVKEVFNSMTMNNELKNLTVDNGQFRTLSCKEDFRCNCQALYQALTHQEMVQAYTGHDSTVDSREGGLFSLFDGNVTGQFIHLEPHKKIVTKWRFKNWPVDHFSDVTISITDNDDGCKLVLQQKNIPAFAYEQTMHGWTQNYWGRIRTVFGFGGRIF